MVIASDTKDAVPPKTAEEQTHSEKILVRDIGSMLRAVLELRSFTRTLVDPSQTTLKSMHGVMNSMPSFYLWRPIPGKWKRTACLASLLRRTSADLTWNQYSYLRPQEAVTLDDVNEILCHRSKSFEYC